MLAKSEFFKVYAGFILPKKIPLKPIIDQKYEIVILLGNNNLTSIYFKIFKIIANDRKWFD